MSLSQFPAYTFINDSLLRGPALNARKNIIAGPNQGDYWAHSRGLEVPDYREEGPLPIQGNIGALLKQEGDNNYASCSSNISIGGAPNCTGVFNSDVFTVADTCGSNCKIGVPEAFGMQSFGMTKDLYTNIHGLHAYQNVRAGIEGRGPSDVYGCYEWVPNLRKTSGNSCELDFSNFEQNTTGDFTKLSNWQNFASFTYKQ